MKHTIGLLVLMACLAVSAAHAAPPEGPGWESLFNGKDLTGWTIPEQNADIWTVEDGVLVCHPRTGGEGEKSLWSTESFGDFTLHVEWRLTETKGEYDMPEILPDGSYKLNEAGEPVLTPTPNADSGVYLRGTSKAQVNIWCWPVGSGEVWGYRTDADVAPEVRAGVTPKMNADKPVGEWNTFVITMQGELLTVELNGEKVIENAQLPGVAEEGPIALQHHGGYDAATGTWNSASSLVEFRNIYVKELDGKEDRR